MPLLPDSGDPGDIHEQLGIGEQKPDLLTDATWKEINQEFQLYRAVGSGGQAVVFPAKERNAPHREVALKVYHENSDTARQQFENECRILASDRLPPEVVGYYRCVGGQGQRQPYLVLEFIDGPTLAKLATSAKQPLAFDVKVELIEQLGRSFQRLHECNLIFGDGSANNILVETDNVLRFVDLAGAKELHKGHGRTRSSINLVTPGFFAQTDADAAVAKEVRTNLASDLYAMSANAFLLLTGRSEDQCRSGGSRSAEREWDQALAQVHVPRGLRAIVLKGLRVPDPSKSNDLRLYPSAKAFANDVAAWRTRRQQRRSAVVFGLPALVCVAVLAVVALVGWSKYEAERTAFELRQFQALQERLPSLAKQPAIDALIKQVDELAEQRQQQIASQQTNLAATTLKQMTQKLEQAFDTSAALEPCIELRLTLEQELQAKSSDPNEPVIIPWLTECQRIQEDLAKLGQRSRAIKTQLEEGQTKKSYADLVALQKDILHLKKQNDEALKVRETHLQRYDALHASVSARLKAFPEFNKLSRYAKDGQASWHSGDWASVKTNFGIAQEKLDEWLKANETEAERKSRDSQLQADREAGLRTEVARIAGERDTARNERDGLQTSLAALNDKLKAKDADTAKEKLRADELAKDKTKLAEQLNAVKDSQTEQRTKLAEVEQQLTATVQARDQFKTEAERWKKLATDNPGVVIPFNDKLTEIEKSLGSLDTKNWDATQAAFVKAGTEYRKIEGERAALVAPNQFEAKHPLVKAKDSELAQAQDLLNAALKKLDTADKIQHETLQKQIDSRQKLHEEERALGVAEQNDELVKLRSAIAALTQKQAKHADGYARATGAGKVLALADVLKLTGVAAGVADLSNLKAGDLRVITVKGKDTHWRWIPPGKFKMGSPIGEKGRDSDEDQKDVTISKGFWMLETEVTQELWTAVMGSSLNWDSYGKGPKHPVYNVSHTEALEFCVKFNAILKLIPEAAGLAVRLPTEAEWEYAARAGTTTRYYWGDRDEDADQYAWHSDNSKGGTQPVGLKKENAWGLKDMSGNVWEGCSDWYDAKLVGGIDPRGPSSRASSRVLRGGSWISSVGSGSLRSADRGGYSPEGRDDYLGFRVACSSVGG